jgi:membrane protein
MAKVFTFELFMAKRRFNISNTAPFRYLFKKARGVELPGRSGASLYDLGKFFFADIRTLKLQERAAAVTYNFLMAMPPTFLFLFSLLPYLPFKNVDKTIFNILKLVTPNQNIYKTVHGVVADFMAKQHVAVLSYGILLVLFFSSNGVMGLMRSFDKSVLLYKKRNGLQRRVTAILLTLVLIGLSILTLSVLILQSKDLNPIILTYFHSLLAIKLVSGAILTLLIFITISVIYTYGPSLKQKFKFVSIGSVCATFASVTATLVFFFLVNNFLNYNKVYGSIGTLIAFMVWVWLNTTIILLGYELNVSLLSAKLSRRK